MPAPLGFYFDFISPYAYLGSVGIERIAVKHGRVVDWRPMLLGISMFKVMGLKAIPDTPLKGPYVLRDLPRFARLLGIPFSENAVIKMAPLPALRAFAWAKDTEPARQGARPGDLPSTLGRRARHVIGRGRRGGCRRRGVRQAERACGDRR
jgi:2-hydroxychromene-2-carboxylate isomerase